MATCEHEILCGVGQSEPCRDETNTYPTGQFFLHRVLDYRGVILFPWIATIREKDPCKILGEKNSTDDLNPFSAKEIRSKKRPYYTVLRDNRDAPYLATEEVSVLLGDASNYRGSNTIKGLDYVAHEDIIPYTSEERTVIDHELFNELFMPDAGNGFQIQEAHQCFELQPNGKRDLQLQGVMFLGKFLSTGKRTVFLGHVVGMCIKKLQKTLESQSFPSIWDILLNWVTAKQRWAYAIPFMCLRVQKPEVIHWWGYFVRLENLGEHPVQVIGREWKVISRSTNTAFQLNAPGINGRKPVLSTTTPQKRAFQYNSHISLQDSPGIVTGKYILEREDHTKFECRVPPFSLDSKTQENNPT